MADGMVIPLRMDNKLAIKDLERIRAIAKTAADDIYSAFRKTEAGVEKLGKTGKKAGDEVAEGMGHAEEGAKGLLESMVEMEIGKRILDTIVEVGEQITETMKEAAEHTAELAKEFINLQKEMQEVAALSGHPATRQFSMGEIRKAEAANVLPAEWAAASRSFRDKAGAFVGKGPDAKMSDAEADKFQASIAEFAKSKGVSPAAMAELGGGILLQQKAPKTADEMTALLGKVYGTLEGTGKSPTENLAGMQKAMGAGFTAEGAAQTLAMMPRLGMKEARALDSTLSELERAMTEGKLGAKQGVTPGMDPKEMLQNVSGYLSKKMKAGDSAAAQDKILQKELGAITKSAMTTRMLSRMAKMGPGLFSEMEAKTAAISDTDVQEQIAADRKTGIGKDRAAEAHGAAAEAKTGARYAGLNTLKKEAKAQLEEEGRFQEVRIGEDAGRYIIGKVMGTNAKAQLIDERARELALQKKGMTQKEAHAKQLPILPTYMMDELTRRDLNATDPEDIDKDPQEKIHKELTRQTKHLEDLNKHARAGAVAPTLSAPPAQRGPHHGP